MSTTNDCLAVELPSGKRKNVPIALDLPAGGGAGSSVAALLTHGASSGISSGILPAVAAAFAAEGIPCLRFECKGPLAHRATVAAAIMGAARPGFERAERYVVGGHSMGGRVACELAHSLPEAVAAVLLLSYPLHPPGRPAELRDTPLAELRQPLLFVRGTRDPFSQGQPWAAVQRRLRSGRVEVHSVEGGDHSLAVPGGLAARGAAVDAAVQAVQAFVREVASAAGQAPQQKPAVPTGAAPAKRRRQR